ncbi:MAG: hypothetical protein ABIL16_05375 [candidate division WOR-3 bacterium]
MRRFILLLIPLILSCGRNELEIWYWFGEIHDYHFRQLLNRTWRKVNVSLIRKNFSSIQEMEESLKVRQPDLALVYPQTLKNLIKSGELEPLSDGEILPNYCGNYCWPMFKSVLGFYVNADLAKEVGFPLNFKLSDLLNLNSNYIVLGVYPSATFYTGLMFKFLSEGYDTLESCIKSYEFLKGLAHKPYVRIYPNPRYAEADMVSLKIVVIVGTSAYKPYIEREGINLKFVPIINDRGENVYFLSGPDFVVFKGGNTKKAKEFIRVLDEILKRDTLWERFGYFYVGRLKGLKNIFTDINWDVDRDGLRVLSERALNPQDSLPQDSLKNLCRKSLK